MKIISARNHGYLDFLTVVIFLLAPTLLDLSQIPAMLAYGLAAVHLTVTLASDFSLGIFKMLAFTLHGWIERIVGPVLVAIPFILGFADEAVARNFYIAMGLIIIVAGLLTNYREENR
ncbi:hypothetical protein [Nitrosomonas sp. Nm132]|jgi:hypothetical protein|uniref:hypothetical protein n=1 Tax=Nitrosomonas sp. Nm132 TaxID=1881053 RepID=UPI00088790AB|nr:hypothetical protein [Nitrosomonas sp. Nm132]SDG83746.1 hypothetical protein SAMN05428952_100169 [Nitrosomonas sp. Nm132]